jgi:hypothetical protein
MKKYATILATLVFISACVSPVDKVPLLVGGSRADGTITLSYEYTEFEKPVVNFDEARETAEKRCQA